MKPIERILVYTPNSIGLGHLFRTSAVVTGIRRWRPEIDFLVLTGSALPQVLSNQGIEVVKLPGVRQEIDQAIPTYRPRHLTGINIEKLMDFRRKIIGEAFEFFKPDVVILEHKIKGLLGEALVLLQKKSETIGRPGEFALVHLSRGITGRKSLDGYIDLGQGPGDLLALYDFLYILEDDYMAPAWRRLSEANPSLAPKIKYLGRTVFKNKVELPLRREVLARLFLPDLPIVLAVLGRHGDIAGLFARIVSALKNSGHFSRHQLVLVEDPYLDPLTGHRLKAAANRAKAILLPFVPDLVDLIGISDLVICRAGYNMVNEVLMTGVRALVIPEHHPSGEQEIRVESLHGQIRAIHEKQALEAGLENMLSTLMAGPAPTVNHVFDKYEIAHRMVKDLEAWTMRGKGEG